MALRKIRLGDLLVQNNIISQFQLDQALAEQQRTGRKLGRVFIELGFIQELSLLEFLSRQLQIPLLNLKQYKIDPEVVQLLTETQARRFRAMVLSKTSRSVIVAMADPTDLAVYDELNRLLKLPVQVALVKEADLLEMIGHLYHKEDEITHLAEKISDEMKLSDFDLSALPEDEDLAEAPVVKLLESLFEDALRLRTSDIHIEPDEKVLRIRQRVDGVLHEHVINDKRAANALVSRLKLMSGLNISERRLPQDGRFSITVKGKVLDVRISTLPIRNGESVVMRLLDRSSAMLNLGQLGMPETLLAEFRKNIFMPHGLVLVTGPTGSGKTTTLYAALNELNSPEKKIITAEDPVEYTLSRVNQTQVNPAIGLTFAHVLRAALRQDPDIVLVGEMRDQETVEIALRAALTGHLVLSTLHTNSAIGSASRLLDMGAEGYLVAAALRAIVAQRLVRRICSNCSADYQPNEHELTFLTPLLGRAALNAAFKRGAGCSQCDQSGYKGRIGVYELLETDKDTLECLRRNDMQGFSEAAKRSKLFKPFIFCAFEYAKQGITTLAEVIRIAGGGD